MPGMLRAAALIEPCMPTPADAVRLQRIHEIKHDGYRLMARRDPVDIRLITRRGNDWFGRRVIHDDARKALARAACLVSLRSARGLH